MQNTHTYVCDVRKAHGWLASVCLRLHAWCLGNICTHSAVSVLALPVLWHGGLTGLTVVFMLYDRKEAARETFFGRWHRLHTPNFNEIYVLFGRSWTGGCRPRPTRSTSSRRGTTTSCAASAHRCLCAVHCALAGMGRSSNQPAVAESGAIMNSILAIRSW